MILAVVIFAGCTYPKDPENSFEKAQKDELKVGVVVNPPFTTFENGSPGGEEIEILRDFAKSENLQISFEEGSESDLIKKMEEYEIQIIAGGFEKKTIWIKKAGPSATYDKKHVFLVPKGENRLLQELETFIFKNIRKS